MCNFYVVNFLESVFSYHLIFLKNVNASTLDPRLFSLLCVFFYWKLSRSNIFTPIFQKHFCCCWCCCVVVVWDQIYLLLVKKASTLPFNVVKLFWILYIKFNILSPSCRSYIYKGTYPCSMVRLFLFFCYDFEQVCEYSIITINFIFFGVQW